MEIAAGFHRQHLGSFAKQVAALVACDFVPQCASGVPITGPPGVPVLPPVPVVPVALCHLWGSLFSRRDPLHKRRPNKLWARIEMRVGAAIPPAKVNAARVEAEIRRLRGADR